MSGHRPHYIAGEHLFVCDRCGFVFHSHHKKKEWNGKVVCDKCWEPRHPQDFVRAHPDRQSVGTDARPDSDPVYVTNVDAGRGSVD